MYLKALRISRAVEEEGEYPACLPVVRHLLAIGRLRFTHPVTFFVGENGTGKSTLLEGLAVAYGFNPEGGTIHFHFSSRESHSPLYRHITLARSPLRPRNGFFLRAESFYNVASEIDHLDETTHRGPRLVDSYGGVSLHKQSHGESFMSLVLHRFGGQGLYILDEPEAALSPSRQMALLAAIHRLVKEGSQFLISTHSPILMAYPNSVIYELDEEGMRPTPYQETSHYQLTCRFLNTTEKMLEHLLRE